jgi:hypothetical protein
MSSCCFQFAREYVRKVGEHEERERGEEEREREGGGGRGFIHFREQKQQHVFGSKCVAT